MSAVALRPNCPSGHRETAAAMSGPEMKSKAAIAFKIEGELTVVDSTTVICLRQAPDAVSTCVPTAT